MRAALRIFTLLAAALVLPAAHAFQISLPAATRLRDASCPLSLRMSEAQARPSLSKFAAGKAIAYLSAMFVGMSAAPHGARARELVPDAPTKARLHTVDHVEKRAVIMVAGAAMESPAGVESGKATASLAKPMDVESVMLSVDISDKKQVSMAASVASVAGLWYIVSGSGKKDEGDKSSGTSSTIQAPSPKAAEKKEESPAEALLRMKKEELSSIVLKPRGTGVGVRPSSTVQFKDSKKGSKEYDGAAEAQPNSSSSSHIGRRPLGMHTSTLSRSVDA